jgi:ABC-type transport system involved in cytochrome c biogenesis ATPase subunit
MKLYHESAALIRAIMDLRECEAGKVSLKESKEEIMRKIEDAKRWLGFLKNIGKDST